ncbi:hypothetical protein KKE45_00035, partial [Patescibacteria group bacterium]|nr:hypothetical protein [Patescibacteria group bacterium]
IYKKLNKSTYKKILLSIPILLIFTINFPVFKNHLFASEVKKSIPQEYFQLSNFFDKQATNSRIALFPETDIWGWYNYSWGYTGSGFLWHFIRQPIISRSYDVWNQNSENYFWEISHAINSRNDKDILNTLKKYQVSYLLIDYSLSGDSNKSRIKQIDFLNKFISNNLSPNSLVFKSPNLSVHKLNGSSQFSITTSLTNTGPDTNRLYQDNIFSTHTNYQNNSRKQYDYYYPFIDLQTQSYNPKQLWQISEENNNFIITTTLPNTLLRYSFLTQPDTNDQLPINIKTNNNQLIISFPKIPINFENYTSTYDCSSSNSYQKKGSNLNISSNQNMLSISVTNKAKACWSYHYDSISGIDSYLLSINPAQILGPPPIMNIESHTTKNLLSKQQINKTGKNYYIIPQTSSQDRGISAHFEIQSYLQSNSHFTTAIPQLYLFPEQFLKQIYFTKHSPTTSSQTIPTISKKINPWLHKLSITNQQHILIFNQSFDSDWIAFYFNGIKPVFLKNHILINNWANGWEIVRNADLHSLQIYIFFWPQLLQFLGFALLILAFIYIFRKS